MAEELWCIKVTPENAEVLGRWREDGTLGKAVYGHYVNSMYNNRRGWCSTNKMEEFTEMSFEWFKQYILKEAPKEPVPIDNYPLY